ncbi:Arm DNA-binding domain-containing protein [Pedobacter gandavensis]|uniref:Arm DNA-binding domain-containing protein n=1 Tax=Pedobacter gandavensis TaxID=2679963 RepID=UPI00292F7088|nr:Arm DNA-binding domain-containing protein [Pedobacter gandavensis]
MKTNFSMLFYLKKQKNYACGDAPIYLRITVERNRVEITTGQECKPECWNPKTGRLTGTKEDIKRSNAYLDGLQAMVYWPYKELIYA